MTVLPNMFQQQLQGHYAVAANPNQLVHVLHFDCCLLADTDCSLLLCMLCRKRRLYACQSIAELVAQEGLDLQQLSSRQDEQWDALEVFDDTTFESRNHEQWVPQIPGGCCPSSKVTRAEVNNSCV